MLYHTSLGSNENVINVSYSYGMLFFLNAYCYLQVWKNSNLTEITLTLWSFKTLCQKGGNILFAWTLVCRKEWWSSKLQQAVWEPFFLLLKRDVGWWTLEVNFWRLGQREAKEMERVPEFGICWSSLPNTSHCAFGYTLMEKNDQFVVCWGLGFLLIRVNEKPMNFHRQNTAFHNSAHGETQYCWHSYCAMISLYIPHV